jgi:thiol-disulfide isomerase/thioredoxin
MRMQNWLALGLTCFAAAAFAVDKEPYTPERLAALQAEGALVLVDVFADWCPTCARQQEVLDRYVEARPEVDLHVLEVDFDEDRQYVRELRAPRQSTLLLFRGEQQYWYSVAETREEVIFEAIDRAAAAR